MSILLLRRRMMFEQSASVDPVLFDHGYNKELWSIGKSGSSSNKVTIGDVIQTSTTGTGNYINLYFINKLNLSRFSTLNITFADDSSARAVNLWAALATSEENIINYAITNNVHRWRHLWKNVVGSAGQTHTWNFRASADGNAVPYSDSQDYFVVIAASSYGTSESTKISKVWLE